MSQIDPVPRGTMLLGHHNATLNINDFDFTAKEIALLSIFGSPVGSLYNNVASVVL
jgi:hypothetical protein